MIINYQSPLFRYQTKFLFFFNLVFLEGKENKSNFIKNNIGNDEKNIFKKFLLSIFIW